MNAEFGDAAGQPAQVIEHDRARQSLQQISRVRDLVATQMNLDVQAEWFDAFRQRLNHVDGGGRGLGIELGEADAAHTLGLHRLQFGVGHGRMDHRDAACLRTELRQGVERDCVVDVVGGGLHDDDAARANALLEQRVFLNARVGLHPGFRPRRRETRAIVDMHVAITRVGRGFECRRGGAGGIGDLDRCYVIHAGDLIPLFRIVASIPPQSMICSARP